MRSGASKRRAIRWVALLLISSSLVACNDRVQARYDAEFLAMGTRVQLSVLSADATQAAAHSTAVERQLLRQGIDWYPWTIDASGELRQLNSALAAGHMQTVSPALITLLRRAINIYQRSDGYFDPAVAPLVLAWGFADLGGKQPQLAAASLLNAWVKSHATMSDLHINGQQVSSTRRDLQLDLGAIAKGYALQLAMQTLQQTGCSNAMLNLGGQLVVMGAAMSQQLSVVAIREPRAEAALAELHLADGESISTSGDYERYAQIGTQRIHHLLDPHTGRPVPHTQSVTVVSSDPTLADAASTALMAAGAANWQRIARQLGVRDVLRIDATGAIEVTAALYARLHWAPAALQRHHITQITL